MVGVAGDGLPDERRAPVPLSEQREEPADHLEVDEGLRVEGERVLGLGEGGGGLALDEQRERQGRARPLARRVEADGVLGEGQALLDRGVGRSELERVVRHVQPRELAPRERALRIRGHGAPQRLQGGDEVRRLARQEEAVRAEERPVGRSVHLRWERLTAQDLGHDPLLRGDPGGHDLRRLPVEVPGLAPGSPGTPRPRPVGRSGSPEDARTLSGDRPPPGAAR